MRRGGRVSNTIKTLEQGAKQANKLNSYFSKSGGGDRMVGERGHPLARMNLCVGVKRRLDVCESENDFGDVGRSARKRERETK